MRAETENTQRFAAVLPSPVGRLGLICSPTALLKIEFNVSEVYANGFGNHTLLQSCAEQLEEYFGGRRKIFDLPLDPPGSIFRQRVWYELLKIPYGSLISYRELAHRLGNPLCIRAAASANGANPLPIVIPCHRVIGSNGSLVGFGGGIPAKKWLIEHETRTLSLPLF